MGEEQLSDDEFVEELLTIVAKEGMVDRDALKLEALLTDLEIESIDFVQILMAVEEKFDVYLSFDNEMSEISTVQELVSVVTKKIAEQKQQASN